MHSPLAGAERRLRRFALAMLALSACLPGPRTQRPTAEPTALVAAAPPDLQAFARSHAAWCHSQHEALERRARHLLATIHSLRTAPSSNTLAAARAAWIDARRIYGRIEVLRFQNGPIEPLEPFLNSWPVDEAHIDGMLRDATGQPSLTGAVLRLANERGGEANICTGWHAAEYLLWGQDRRADGCGDRAASDFDGRHDAVAARRNEFLHAIVAMLVGDLTQLRAAWAPDRDNHRRRFESDGRTALRDVMAGAVVLTAFELGGERLTVAYETRDQEQEHSCFSDTTHLDLEANQMGIVAVILGDDQGSGTRHPGILSLLASADSALAELARKRLGATCLALQAIPKPFDQAILGLDDTPNRRALAAAIEAMEQQTEALLLVGAHFGLELPLRPGF